MADRPQPWAGSVASALTGRAGGPPLLAPAGVVERMQALGATLGVDTIGLLGDRAASLRLTRLGRTSCGRAARLVRAADGWLAVNLPRDDDVDCVPAWLGLDGVDGEVWSVVEREVTTRQVDALVAQATLLGLPVSSVGETPVPARPVRELRAGDAPPLDRPPLVVDLSSLWAGPLCARLLADRGARVVKVETPSRPDGARLGPKDFWDRLHHDTESVVLDLVSPELAALLHQADVVIEASRPRALRQHGVSAAALLAADDGPRVWVSITAHGRSSERVGFGDDAAAAGGLVAWEPGQAGPVFVADAAADPLTGVAAATATVEALAAGGRWLLDAALAGVAAWVAGDDRYDPKRGGRFSLWEASPSRASGPEKPRNS